MAENKFKIGLFGANCSGGIAPTTVPERWEPTWENNVELARIADDAGLDFMLPLGRWAGAGGETDHNGSSFETLTWASGILASTKQIKAFSTLHVAFINPVFAAKQMVTADNIGNGRFGLNIVCGWNEEEFNMLGIRLKEHQGRYDQGEEWLNVVKRIWTETEPFDHDGDFYTLKNVRAQPKPISEPWPLVMNAATSVEGRDFAVRNANYLFRFLTTLEAGRDDVAKVQADAKAKDRDVGVFTNVYVVCRPTTKEAEDYHHYYAIEKGDEGAIESMYIDRGIRDNPHLTDEMKAFARLRLAGGNGAYPIIGDPDSVAAQLKELSDIGIAGIATGLVNYTEHFPYFRDEVLPRLERAGLRQESRDV